MTVIAAAVLLVVSGIGDTNAQALVHSDRTSSPARRLPQMEACAWPTPADCEFAAGYLDGGGRPDLLRHLIMDVRPCEGEWGVAYTNGYVSAFQFAPSTWRNASSHTGATDPLRPYDVGLAVAWLLSVTTPGGTGNWPVCWWRGSIP